MAMQEAVRELMDYFRQLVQALRTSHRAAEHLNLTGAQLFIINVIGESDSPLSVGEVAEKTLTDQSTVSVVVTRLVDRGLVARTRSHADSRRAELSLTPAGRKLYRRGPTTLAQRRLASALLRLKPADATALRRILAQIIRDTGAAEEPAVMMFADGDGEAKRSAKRAKR
jgi:MarR family transcriptional regulator, lower aerobic nicotinate degradation pathway regulator